MSDDGLVAGEQPGGIATCDESIEAAARWTGQIWQWRYVESSIGMTWAIMVTEGAGLSR